MQFIENFLTSGQAQDWMNKLDGAKTVAWQRESFRIFGRQVEAPRQLAWFGDSGLNYRYTGIDHLGEGWPDGLLHLKQQVEEVASQSFNFLLLNRYHNGRDYMGWHRDDEQGCLGNIASLSLGATRRFSIDTQQPPQRQNFELSSGSLLIFDGRQRHCLRQTKRPCDVRVNLTFRLIAA